MGWYQRRVHGEINLRSPNLKMNSKISLILFGLLVTLAVLAAAENGEENSLSEEVASSRLARSADPEAGKRKKSKKNKNKRKRKSKKSRKNKKAKKAAKKAKKAKKSNKKERMTGRAVDGTCLESAALAMNRWRGVVANFNKQKTRIEKQSDIASKKGAKKAVFAPIALKLVDLGGGNKSALTCSGSATSDGAKQLTNLTKTLFDCEVEVNKTCSMDFPAPNMTFVGQCAKDIETFENKTTECYALSKADTAADACTCWTDAEYTELGNKIKSCKIAETSDVAKGLKACKDAFSKCRKYEDDAVASMAACSVSADALKKKAAALSANVDSAKAAATKVAAVTGSSRAAATTCAAFITLVTKFVAIIQNYPASPQVLVVGKYLVGSAAVTCTALEKAELKLAETSLTEAKEFLAEALSVAQANLLDATGSTLSASELLEYTTVSATTVASRF